eukprot:CAMPEP_0206443406 /NCGR_PEP_ID=MMETSP0324_2-20121206/14346_1 /ASSEMBLY_ACC=CAM_ASM_000836 /TAXON_ID=2866 /ORGANISM="Crypthecodinium cohnii, Strain Seligo" /LENGTH=498 /DNA_ID=CAMNT_0053911329 /DNA_START=48 /DNA_END=1544 /DNA_ORIENTATION=-
MVARLQTLSATVLTVFGLSLAESDRQGFLQDLYNGRVSKSHVELVLAQHDEDIAWSNPLKSVRTVYCKGGSSCDADAIVLPNVGREGQTFLHHIVNNYDRLSDWTVFSQAAAPTEGYYGHKHGGGHLLSGSSIDDYLAHHHETKGQDDSFFLMSSKVHLATLQHALRSSFKVSDGAKVPQISHAAAVCPKEQGSKEVEDVWGDYHNMPMLKSFLEKKCGVEASALSAAMLSFWEDFVQLPLPENEVVYYAQGARFAVSRERLQQRSKAYYQALLDGVSGDVDPCLNYLYEMSWYYVTGMPSVAPCSTSQEDLTRADASSARFLDDGVSGVSNGEDGEPTPVELVTVTVVMEMTADDLAEFQNNETKQEQLKESFANSLDGVEASWVSLEIQVDGSDRRLQATTTSVTIVYVITFPEDASVSTADVVAATNADSFKNTLAGEILESTGLTVVVSSASGVASTETVTSTTTTTYSQPAESSCTRSSIAGLLVTLLAALLP